MVDYLALNHPALAFLFNGDEAYLMAEPVVRVGGVEPVASSVPIPSSR